MNGADVTDEGLTGSRTDLPESMLLHYGLDARARSALRAYASHDADTRRKAAQAIESALGPQTGNVLPALRRFVELYVLLPGADFDSLWLYDLTLAWLDLHRQGVAADIPLRAARALAAHGADELLRQRSSLSPLEVEIVNALAGAGMCIAEALARTVAPGASEIASGTNTALLAARIAQFLDEAEGRPVGLLMLRLCTGSATLSLSRGERDALWEVAVHRVRTLLRAADLIVDTEPHGCAIILPGLQTHAQVRLAATKLAHALEAPLAIDQTEVRAAFALGAVWSPDHGTTPEDLMRCVDLAAEKSRRDERPFVVFDDGMLAQARREALLEQEFPAALENGQMAIHLQPQIDLASGRCIGAEALLRWTDSRGEPVPPYRIPEVARRIGATLMLTRWLVLNACRTVSELDRLGLGVSLSVNLMGSDMMDEELPLLVDQAIRFWRIAPASLTFELTESMMLEDAAVGAVVMQRLIDLGVATSIDDFGIGYSSILHLRQLPLHELKIDCVFVGAMARTQQDREIVDALVRLSHALGLRVVAEGIEDEATMHLLRDIGCDRGQGYWISRAMPIGEFPAWIEAWNRQAAG